MVSEGPLKKELPLVHSPSSSGADDIFKVPAYSWRRTTVVTVVALILFSGLVIGTSFAIAGAWKQECKMPNVVSTDKPQPGAAPATTFQQQVESAVGSVRTLVAETASKAALATRSAVAYLETEAIHDSAVWEAYIMYRGHYGMAAPLIAHHDAAQQIEETMTRADRSLLEDVDLPTAASALATASEQLNVLVESVQGAAPQSMGKVISTFAEEVSQVGALLTQGVPEVVLLDARGTVTTTQKAWGSVAPLLDGSHGNDATRQAATAVMRAVDEALVALKPHSREAADFWLTKLPKPEDCEQEVAKAQEKCDAKLSELRQGVGCTNDCDKKIQEQEQKCEQEKAEKELKCIERYNFMKACGGTYKGALQNCTATALSSGNSGEQLSVDQWACKEAAEKARNMCVQLGEVQRKCNEERTKTINACKQDAAACSTQGGAKFSDCMKEETGKRLECKYNKRWEHIRKCNTQDQEAISICKSTASDAASYANCVAAADADGATCKLNIEREVKKCEDERPCKDKKEREEAACESKFTDDVAACATAANKATCEADARTARTACVDKVKTEERDCKVAAAAETQKWLNEQQTKNEISSTVSRYHDVLPFTLLTNDQRTAVTQKLDDLSRALQAANAAWVALPNAA